MLFLLVGINLITSVAIFALPSENTKLPRSLATAAAAISLAISIVIFATYDQDVGGYQFQQLLDWLPAMGISLHFGVDGISSPMVLLTGVVSLTAILVSRTIDTRCVCGARFVLPVFLLRSGCTADVPTHWPLGQYEKVLRIDEACNVSFGRKHSCMGSNIGVVRRSRN